MVVLFDDVPVRFAFRVNGEDDGLRNKKGELIQKQDLTVDMESQEKLPGPANGEGPECGDTREPEGWTERHQRNASRLAAGSSTGGAATETGFLERPEAPGADWSLKDAFAPARRTLCRPGSTRASCAAAVSPALGTRGRRSCQRPPLHLPLGLGRGRSYEPAWVLHEPHRCGARGRVPRCSCPAQRRLCASGRDPARVSPMSIGRINRRRDSH
ncbi:hypothetical protein QTO34_010882 [Cnephaeus nilssonii]|uniref:Uncharacterized protein n=1 Tax=Cnephaeus nilssonii TaxID=3371016 RepID=A0AA40LDJ4_CNENI|nr:hypothetical protein QTO34_010882 [Eptesicus nilssonii]